MVVLLVMLAWSQDTVILWNRWATPNVKFNYQLICILIVIYSTQSYFNSAYTKILHVTGTKTASYETELDFEVVALVIVSLSVSTE